MSSSQTVVTADDVAAQLLQELGTMEAMKLQKLLYYAQAWHLAIMDRPLFADAVEAWRNGPVVHSIFKQHQGQRFVSDWRQGNPDLLDDEAHQLISLVCVSYGQVSGDDLSKLTHIERPWAEARRGLTVRHGSRRSISHADMKTFFRGKKLAGRTSSDLATGGLALTASHLDKASVADSIEGLRNSFSCQPTVHPNDLHGNSGRSSTGIDPHIAALLDKRRAKRIEG